LATAQSMASVLSHLHARGLLHGDFYGHNILCSPDRKPVLSDFGAASALPADVDQAKALQKLDVLAYGHLLQELADGVSADAHSESTETRATLRQWQARCTQTDAAARPAMAEVAQALAALG
jgi:serine/threonine protein kinase